MADWSRQRQWLVNYHNEVTERLNWTDDYSLRDMMADELSELSMYDNHPGDIGTELFERGKDVGLRDMDKLRLQEAERALQAIDAGTYGTCQMCGQPIPAARLEAYPLATMCVKCKEEDEHRHPDRSRPIEEEFLTPGFARTVEDDTNSVVFDGEDSWQAVERFNQRDQYVHDVINGHGEVLDENAGIVDDMDRISNEQYKAQLP